MGANMTRRLLRGGHRVVVYDRGADAVAALAAEGAGGAASLAEVVAQLAAPRAIWLMIPAGNPVEEALAVLTPLLAPGDVVVDGGNSNFKDSQRRAVQLAARGVHFLDVGTSGGIWGLENGYCLMAGGAAEAFALLEPALRTLAPATPPGAAGYAHVGPSGAGHFTKMIHNGIEYGMMQAYAEGFELLAARRELDLDLAQIAGLWRHGSVVRSWLLDLAYEALRADPGLASVAPFVEDSGEGRWTVLEAIEQSVPAPVITLSLMRRFASRQESSFAHRLLAALRAQFGGHRVHRAERPS
jgi:6-phosphogluconate dehydrogenase